MRDELHNGGVERSGNALGGCIRSDEKLMMTIIIITIIIIIITTIIINIITIIMIISTSIIKVKRRVNIFMDADAGRPPLPPPRQCKDAETKKKLTYS